MTAEAQSTPTTPPPEARDPSPQVNKAVHRIVEDIKNERLSTGEVAELRRLEHGEPDGAAFWKIAVLYLDDQMRGEDAETRWALVLYAIGVLHEQQQLGRRLGSALAAAGVSEMRLARLLRADLASLPVTLRAVLRQLASAAERVDLADVAWLVVSARGAGAPRASATKIRRRIARDYYRGLRKAAEDSKSESSGG